MTWMPEDRTDSYPQDVQDLLKDLWRRRSEGVIVTRMIGTRIGPWKRQEKWCHDNVAIWCSHVPAHKPVPGFLLFAFAYMLPAVRFTPHSVIETEEGELLDITPSQARDSYPFIRHIGSAEVFETAGKLMQLDFAYRRLG